MMLQTSYDYLIIGAGIIGLSLARALSKKFPSSSVCILEKESSIGKHSSGRNSGILHSGIYYAANTLKAQFSHQGQQEMLQYCHENHLPIKYCGKVIVASTIAEIPTLLELKKRATANNATCILVDEHQLRAIEPAAKTQQYALFAPDTASISPLAILQCLLNQLQQLAHITIRLNEGYKCTLGNNTIISTQNRLISATKIINAAGLYADKIAQDFNFAQDYALFPMKGMYLHNNRQSPTLKTHIYPVPNLQQPFLGVHFSLATDGSTKIGPTATPALWREHYRGCNRFSFNEFRKIAYQLFLSQYKFQQLYSDSSQRQHILQAAAKLSKNLDLSSFQHWSVTGIRAQLINIKTTQFVNDFIVETHNDVINVLNVVSPGFTCALPFARWIVENYV